MPKPTNRSQLETFLGIMVYLMKFVPNLSHLSTPLRILLEKGVEWSWESKQDEAFHQLIEIASSTPELWYYNASKSVKLATDASNKGFCAMISQEDQPVAYASCRLNTDDLQHSLGHYRFRKMPFGISSASEIWQWAMVEEFEHIAGIGIIMDDMLMCAENDEQHDTRIAEYFDRV